MGLEPDWLALRVDKAWKVCAWCNGSDFYWDTKGRECTDGCSVLSIWEDLAEVIVVKIEKVSDCPWGKLTSLRKTMKFNPSKIESEVLI